MGAADGFFQMTNRSTKKEASNVISFYSGYYESYGVNCQMCVRSNLQFTYFGVVSPGATNNNISFAIARGMKDVLENLPRVFNCAADAAYTLSENVLIPFTGSDRFDPTNDAFVWQLYQPSLWICLHLPFFLSLFAL